MTDRTVPNTRSIIRTNLISGKFIFIGPHRSNIRIFSSQTIETGKNFSVVTIRTISFPVYNIFNRSIIVAMANGTSPDSVIAIYKCFVCWNFVFLRPHGSNIWMFYGKCIKSRKWIFLRTKWTFFSIYYFFNIGTVFSMTCITDPFKPTPGIIKNFIWLPYVIWRVHWNILREVISKSIDAFNKLRTFANRTIDTRVSNSPKRIITDMSIFTSPCNHNRAVRSYGIWIYICISISRQVFRIFTGKAFIRG